jgi:hypothetical protein
MARFLKNPDLSRSGSQAARLPIVASGSFGDAPVTGLIRFNQATSRIEFYYNGAWNQVAKIGSVQLAVDTFTSNGTSTQIFTMSQSESDPTSVAVFIGGVYQQPNTNYTVDGSTNITFTAVPPAPTGMSPNQIVVIHNINSTNVAA